LQDDAALLTYTAQKIVVNIIERTQTINLVQVVRFDIIPLRWSVSNVGFVGAVAKAGVGLLWALQTQT
jgi:hypothetical protein